MKNFGETTHLKHNLLVLGSQNHNPKDQKISRSKIRPVQILNKGGRCEPAGFFNDWGKAGVSSIAWPDRDFRYLVVSVNDELRKLYPDTGNWKTLEIPQINDVHDIHFIDGNLWISNTEFDEIIEFDTEKEKVIRRISLEKFRTANKPASNVAEKVKDRFHCNQAFKDYDGNLCVLIHHISGWQYYRILFEMLVKNQGDGGVINLGTGEIIPLKLQSPHTVRKIGGRYWIQDSGDFTTKIYDRNWQLVHSIQNGGFGRGLDCDEKQDIAYIGLSATRKRYMKVIPAGGHHLNRVLMVDLSTRTKLGEIPVMNIEQLDNIYILDDDAVEVFRKLGGV